MHARQAVIEVGLGPVTNENLERPLAALPAAEPAVSSATVPAVTREPGLPVALTSRVLPLLAEDDLQQIEALLHYVVEMGLDKENEIAGEAFEVLSVCRCLESSGSEEALVWAKRLMAINARLNALVGPTITGRTIRSSAEYGRYLRGIRFAGMALFAGAVLIEISAREQTLIPQTTAALAVDYAVPFAWGAIGAIIFLMKTISDRASEFSFDERRLRGLPERVLLGALMGTVLVKLFGVEDQSFSNAALGFVAGLGTKAIYAAFETLVNGVAQRISGKAPA
jgi:hypothetical protein